MVDLDAPITAVTVHLDVARVTRLGLAQLLPGTSEVVLAGLPTWLDEASLRASGKAETAVRIVGVEARHRLTVSAPDDRVAAAEAAVRDAERIRSTVETDLAAEEAQERLLESVIARSGAALAKSLAVGTVGTDRIAEVGGAVADQLRAVGSRRQLVAERHRDAALSLAAAQAALDALRSSGRDRLDVVLTVEADAAGPVGLEIGYTVGGAGWRPVYDARVPEEDGPVELTLAALITQSTGEDWPACELTVSTSRPTHATEVPELDPWWVDAAAPPPVMRPRMMASGAGAAAPAPARAMDMDAMAFEVREEVAEVIETAVAASWRLPRPLAVPADGEPHRAVLEVNELPSAYEHVTAPVVGPEVHVRASVANSTGRTLLAGPVSVFRGDAFVGSAVLDLVAPEDDLELALGVDDRVVVERELLRRTADKRRLSSARGAHESWSIEVTNRRRGAISLVVRDRVPVSRHADVKVVDVKVEPKPTEQDELGRFEWRTALAAGATWKASVGFGVEHPRDLPVVGWR